MTDVMKSQIYPTGTKFVVTEETQDSTFGPGTTGFVSYVKGRDQDFGNVFYYRIVTIKRGKTGKERLELNDISTPVFELKDENMTKIMPDEKRRYYVHIEPLVMPDNVLQMADLDFLGYALALSRWIRKLNTRAKHVNAWPNDNDHILNRFIRMDEYYDEDSAYACENFANPTIREDFINRIRVMESTLVKCSLSYMNIVAGIETRALKELMSAKDKVGEEKLLIASLKAYSNKASSLESLANAHSPQGGVSKSSMTKLAAGVSWS